MTQVNTQMSILEKDSTDHPGLHRDSSLSLTHIQPLCKPRWLNLQSLSRTWAFLPLLPQPPWFKPPSSLIQTNAEPLDWFAGLPSHFNTVYAHTEAQMILLWKWFLSFPVLASPWLPITLRTRSQIFITVYKNLFHLVLVLSWPDFPLLSCPRAFALLFPLLGMFFPTPDLHVTPSFTSFRSVFKCHLFWVMFPYHPV